MIEGKVRNREVSVERTSISDQPYSTEPRSVQGGFQPIWHKGLEGKIDSLPVRPRRENSPVGLPRLVIIRCAKTNRVFLIFPADGDTSSGETGRVNSLSRGGQIERRFDEAAAILYGSSKTLTRRQFFVQPELNLFLARSIQISAYTITSSEPYRRYSFLGGSCLDVKWLG